MSEQAQLLREIILDIIDLYEIVLEETLGKIKKSDEILPAVLKGMDKATYQLKGKIKFDVDGDEDNKDLLLYIIDKIEKRYKAIIKDLLDDL